MIRRWWPVAVIVVVLMILGFLGRTRSRGGTLDPNGTGPEGAKALVLLLGHFGADVSLVATTPDPDTDVALVLSDDLDADRRSALSAWIAGGHRLVVADPLSSLQVAGPSTLRQGSTRADGPCPLLGLGHVQRLDVGPSLRLATTDGCFGRTGEWFLATSRVGRGTVVGLGGAGVWINSRLDHDDNAALAVDLLLTRPNTRVAVLTPSHPGSGHRTAWSLIRLGVKLAAIQLLIAFVILAWARGRRFGRPVAESQPVQIPGSEIVTALGDLLHRASDHDAAARQLRAATRQWLASRLRLPPSAGPDVIAARLGNPGAVDVLTDSPVGDPAALIDLARSLSQLRQEVMSAPRN